MQRKFFCSPHNWICLLQNYILSYVYPKDIYKTLKGIGKIRFVSVLTILINLEICFVGFIVNFKHTSHLCSGVSFFNFEHVIAGCDRK